MGKSKWKKIDVTSINDSLFKANLENDALRSHKAQDIEIDIQGTKAVNDSRRLVKKNRILTKSSWVNELLLKRATKKLQSKRNKIDLDIKQDIDDIWHDNINPREDKPTKNIKSRENSVEIPHSGQSYNPDIASCSELMQKELEKIKPPPEPSKEPMTEALRIAAPWLQLEDASFLKKQRLYQLLVLGKLDKESVQKVLLEDDESIHPEADVEILKKSRKLKIKTTAQRNRKKALKADLLKRVRTKRINKLLNDITHINTMLKKSENQSVSERKVKKLKKLKQRFPDIPAIGKVGASSLLSIEPVSPVNTVVGSFYNRGLLTQPPVLDIFYKNRVKRILSRRRLRYKNMF
ncbi:Ribosome biogenesis protein Nop53-GLTSCR2 [Babesia duncani]|uniref:Ribosome biogenesis protein NOP53 n=1 Tax=Babesia duncani TaxID=323732 RepID=A0AAD9PKM8_9APIC|nr:Ribosome biogenesis protein Nop53-GLTSCR2 [Babesia duncani]